MAVNTAEIATAYNHVGTVLTYGTFPTARLRTETRKIVTTTTPVTLVYHAVKSMCLSLPCKEHADVVERSPARLRRRRAALLTADHVVPDHVGAAERRLAWFVFRVDPTVRAERRIRRDLPEHLEREAPERPFVIGRELAKLPRLAVHREAAAEQKRGCDVRAPRHPIARHVLQLRRFVIHPRHSTGRFVGVVRTAAVEVLDGVMGSPREVSGPRGVIQPVRAAPVVRVFVVARRPQPAARLHHADQRVGVDGLVRLRLIPALVEHVVAAGGRDRFDRALRRFEPRRVVVGQGGPIAVEAAIPQVAEEVDPAGYGRRVPRARTPTRPHVIPDARHAESRIRVENPIDGRGALVLEDAAQRKLRAPEPQPRLAIPPKNLSIGREDSDVAAGASDAGHQQ